MSEELKRPDYRCTCVTLRCGANHEPGKCTNRSRGNAGWECRECHETPALPDAWEAAHKVPK